MYCAKKKNPKKTLVKQSEPYLNSSLLILYDAQLYIYYLRNDKIPYSYFLDRMAIEEMEGVGRGGWGYLDCSERS